MLAKSQLSCFHVTSLLQPSDLHPVSFSSRLMLTRFLAGGLWLELANRQSFTILYICFVVGKTEVGTCSQAVAIFSFTITCCFVIPFQNIEINSLGFKDEILLQDLESPYKIQNMSWLDHLVQQLQLAFFLSPCSLIPCWTSVFLEIKKKSRSLHVVIH